MIKWSVDNLFPLCLKPDCSKYNTRHSLAHQRQVINDILNSNYNYYYWQGGVGSAKTRCVAALSAAFAIMLPRSRGLLVRKYYQLNHETLWGFFLESIESAFEQGILEGSFRKCLSNKKEGKHTQCLLPNGSFYQASDTKNLSKVMGPSYDLIAISDAMENDGIDGPTFGTLFHGEGTVGGLQSRLRGQVSTFYRLPTGETRDMRRFLIESNPPPNINELHSIFGREPNVGFLPGTQVMYKHIQSNSVQNDHNPATYVDEIKSQHSDPNDIRRILEGKSIPYYGGKKVITSFLPEVHVNSFSVDKDLPLFVAIDPGYQHPGVVFSQIKRCGFEKEHFIRLSEISNLFEKTTDELASFTSASLLGILEHLKLFYSNHFDYEAYFQVRSSILRANGNEIAKCDFSVLENHFMKVHFCIDKAGNKRYSAQKDRDTDRLILSKYWGIRCRYRNNIALAPSLNRMREAFKKLCLCNIPEQLIDRKCELLIDAYSGGYRYKKNRDGTFSNEPIEDHRYEDIADSDRYGVENFFFTDNSAQAEEVKRKLLQESHNYDWMYRGV